MDKKNRPWVNKVTLEDVQIKWKNFSGKPTDVNPAGGRRNCGIYLPEDIALDMKEKGWNVKMNKKVNDDDPDVYYIEVRINFKTDDNSDPKDPEIFMVTGNRTTRLDKMSILELDRNAIDKLDLTITPSFWEMPLTGASGITAYVDEMYATIVRSSLRTKYENLSCDEEEVPFDMM